MTRLKLYSPFWWVGGFSLLLSILSSGCVHEFPHIPDAADAVAVNLRLVPDKDWETQDFDPSTRGDDADVFAADGWQSRYVVKVFAKDSRKFPVEECVCYGEVGEEWFDFSVSLNPGEWDIYVWRDFCHPSLSFHNAERFEAVSYAGDEYHGAHEMREAFEGMVSVNTVNVSDDGCVVATVPLHRPVAKYVFIATDYSRFCDGDGDKRDGYSVEGVYPLFMPSVYNMFTKQIVDSETGRSYLCGITPLSEDEAMIAFDHVFMNDRDNAAQVQLLLHDPGGGVRSMTTTLTVPLRRGVTTFVRGDFLTVRSGGGIKIDTSFSGEFNIQL